ncbi:MAG: PQQ-binding-like beta-propeller repeat protein [Gemmatimonadota bacterium]|nr:PQQ-binding-like beta-propeller repeat protein [Gemmatimonadota bacterium]
MSARSLLAPVLVAAASSLVACGLSSAQQGEKLFAESCGHCHSAAGTERTPGVTVLSQLSPRTIAASLEDGVMRAEGSKPAPSRGWASPATRPAPVSNPPERAGLNAADVPNLELRWAFAFPGGTNMRTSPAVAGDVAVVAGPFGEVAALDLATGCVRWSYEADATIRGAILVGEGAQGRAVAWFADSRTNAYAVDLESGSLLWRQRVGWHAAAYGTGSPAVWSSPTIEGDSGGGAEVGSGLGPRPGRRWRGSVVHPGRKGQRARWDPLGDGRRRPLRLRPQCRGKRGCFAANSAAVTAIHGAVFAGGLDGVIRAHSTVDGRVIWEFDTTRPVGTVGGVPGRGGAIDGPGPVIAGGMLLVNSGYGLFGQMPGNLLLAFGVGDSARSRD